MIRKFFMLLIFFVVCDSEIIDLLSVIVIIGLSKESCVEEVMFLFDQFKQLGVFFGFMVYNVIVGICVCEDWLEIVLELMNQMCGFGFQLDNVNYIFVFQVCVKK